MGSVQNKAIARLEKESLRAKFPNFRSGDTLRVHAKIKEGAKERIQIFEGVVIKRSKGSHLGATFTVRKVSYNVGVERTFFLHSPRVEKIEVISKGVVRRARLYYLRPLRGRAARIKSQYLTAAEIELQNKVPDVVAEAAPVVETANGNGSHATTPEESAVSSETESAS